MHRRTVKALSLAWRRKDASPASSSSSPAILASIAAAHSSNGSRLAALGQEALPLGAQALVSVAVYSSGLASSQFLGLSLRVSSACFPAASLLGLVSVGTTTALAGHVGRLVRRQLSAAQPSCAERFKEQKQQGQPQGWARNVLAAARPSEATLHHVFWDAFLGVVGYKLMGGRFRNLMPSDVCFPGSFARPGAASLAAVWNGDVPVPAREKQKAELEQMLRRHGCHHCGATTPGKTLIADHIPPSSWITNYENGSTKIRGLLPWERSLTFVKGSSRPLLGDPSLPLPPRPKGLSDMEYLKQSQRLYPQCHPCFSQQGPAVRNNRRILIPKRAYRWLAWHSLTAAALVVRDFATQELAGSQRRRGY